ncbi:MAG: hypothetical protein AAF184_10705 [Pseudomonadota bacterium]
MTHVDRVLLRLLGLPLQRRLLPAFAALLLGVGLADPMIDWTILRAELRAQTAVASTLQISTLIGIWVLTVAVALAPAWQAASAAYLVRQPIGRWRWVRFLLPSLAPALLPIVAVWWLMPLDSVPTLLALSASAAAMMIALSAPRLDTVLTAVLAFMVTGLVTYGALTSMPGHGVLALASLALLPLACTGLRGRRAGAGARAGQERNLLRSATPWMAIARRDLLCIVRCAPGQLRQLALFAVLAGAFLLALRINGGFAGRDLFRAACVLQMLALLPLYDVLVTLQQHLGPDVYRRHWPVSRAQRAAGLLALAGLAAGPSSVAILLAGYAMGSTWIVLLLTLTFTQMLVLVALFTNAGPRAGIAHGWSLWTWLAHTIVACVLAPAAYGAGALVAAALAWQQSQRGLARIAEDGAQGRLRARTE